MVIPNHVVFHLRFETSVEWMNFISIWMDFSLGCQHLHGKLTQALKHVIDGFPHVEADEGEYQ